MSHPQKRGALVLLLVISAVLLAEQSLAAHNATISTNYNPIYELASTEIVLTVENSFFALDAINQFLVVHSGFEVLNLTPLTAWTAELNDGSINWSTTSSAIANWDRQNFGLTVRAPRVDSDSIFNWSLTTTDYAGESQTQSLQLLVLNDFTPPVLAAPSPADNGFVRNASNTASINASDPETGISSVTFSWGDCNSSASSLDLSFDGALWSGQFDLTNQSANDTLCFVFNATNGGDESSSYSGTVTVDGQPPTIILLSPEEGAFLAGSAVFEFWAADDLSPNIDCVLFLDNASAANTTLASGSSTTIALSMDEGSHSWFVVCSDLAGWISQSESRNFVADLSGPTIELTLPPSLIRGSLLAINATITDFSGVAAVEFVLIDPEGESKNLSFVQDGDGYATSWQTNSTTPVGNYSLLITAADSVENLESASYAFELVPNYSISLALSSSAVAPSEQLTALGSVSLDNGSQVDGAVMLAMPEQNLSLELVNGSFNYTFSAPATAGSYVVTASYAWVSTSSAFEVIAPQQPSGPAARLGGGRRSAGMLYQECRSDADCDEGERCYRYSCVAAKAEPEPEPAPEQQPVILEAAPVQPEPVRTGIVELPPAPSTVGRATATWSLIRSWLVGHATSLFRGGDDALGLGLLAALVLAAALALFLIAQKVRPKSRDRLGLDAYLEKRRRRFG